MRNCFSVEQSVSQQQKCLLNALAALLVIATSFAPASDARTHKKAASPAPVSHHSSSRHHAEAPASRHSSSRHHAEATTASGRHSRGSAVVASSRHHREAAPTTHLVAHTRRGKNGRKITVYERVKDTEVAEHHGRHQRGVVVTHEVVHVVKAAPKTRYAYPLSFFMMHPPEFERSALPYDVSNKISRSFHNGYADSYTARSLVRAGLVSYHPLRGGIFWRREPVKYIIMHSTETGIPLSAERVIESWSSSGLRHAGAQYVVERDGTIFQAVDPDLGTVHINIFKTLPGINNDNSIGIEMCHTGHQDYPPAQREAVVKLVSYLQERYKVSDENVITHRYAQQGDHTDPVNFDWDGFIASKNSFRNRAIAYKVRKIKDDVKEWSDVPAAAVTPTTTTVQTTVTTVTPVVPPNTSTVKEYTYTPNGTVNSAVTPPVAPEASTYLQPHRLLPAVPVYKNTTTTTTVTTTPPVVPEPKMILIPPRAESVESTVVAPMVLPKNMPSLRGPIEMAPQAAPGLNAVPLPGDPKP